MTDETARENFLKYGNPDGKGAFAVGIALPRYLQKPDYQLQILVLFFIVVIFVIPGYFYSCIQANQKDVGGVDIDNRRIFTEFINENMVDKHIPGILSYSLEFSRISVKNQEELEILKKIKQLDKVKEALPKPTEKRKIVHVKPICLLMGYMYDILEDSDLKVGSIGDDLDLILRSIPSFMDILLQQTMGLAQAYKMG